MKIFACFIIGFALATILGIISFLGLIAFTVKQTQATEYFPLDFAEGCSKIEFRAGVDREMGRYLNYHYEFIE